ncbi:hypothetical protein [Yoonia sp. R2-816]|uniref:hypothetical protein n=1 Tax=Yoonia sp. R2-816 TaxID=3342638 RepID=UPI0037293037
MGEANKILSVSYGTFSCRLEGFEDSVETMKTVVSYFHELAGHDRFMDMEPQAPDLDELADLTVEDDGTPVEAVVDSGVVSLRIQRPEPTEEEERPSLRLRRDKPAEQPMDEDVSDLDDLTDEASDLDDQDDDVSDLDDDVSDLDDLEDDVADLDDYDDVAASDDDSDEHAEVDDAAELDDAVAEDDLDEVAAEDMDIVEDTEVEEEDTLAADDDTDEDEMVAAEADDADDDMAEAELVAEDDVADDDTADAPFYDPAAAPPAADQDDSVAAKLERIRSLVGRVPPANRTAAPDAGAPAASGSIADRLSALTGKAPQTDDHLVDDFDFKADEAEPLVLSDEDSADDEMADHADDFDRDDAEDTAAHLVDDDDGAEDAAMDADDGETEDDIAMRRDNRSKRDNLPKNDDDAMSRIMSQADERLNEPEGRRHRDAFAQLKAAVAATEAARQLGDQNETTDPRDAFREDLDEAVRSEDEESDEAPAARSVSTPLKLVAEQRIEDEPSDPADRLRQIASVKDDGEGQKGGFAEFASAKGATELADLLEAAAAYIAFVEGDDDFSRPQVMKKVQMASADQFSREDGLRSFGRLLRQSKIIKLNNGRFQVSEDTRFRPDDKAAQG